MTKPSKGWQAYSEWQDRNLRAAQEQCYKQARLTEELKAEIEKLKAKPEPLKAYY